MTVISVIGLGALGASYAARIAAARPEAELRVVASGARADRLRRDGVVVNGTRHAFAVVDAGDPVTPADLVIVAVKCHQLSEAVGDLTGHVGPGTTVLSLLNGITSEAVLAEAFPGAYVPLTVAVGIDAVRDESGVRYTKLGWVEVGDAIPGEPSEALVRLEALLAEVGLACVVRDDMPHALWWKFLVNVGVNQVTALLEAPYALVQADGPARDLMVSAQREVVAVARASGIALTEADVAGFLEVLGTLGGDSCGGSADHSWRPLADAYDLSDQPIEGGPRMTTESFVTFVHVHVTPGAEDAFLAASRVNAANSRQEEGVTRFDVLQQIDDPTRFLLVEGYVSEDAVTAHRATPHYAAWRVAVDDLMAEQRQAVRFLTR